MCFEFSSCFGGRRDDYGGERANRDDAIGHRRGRRGNNNRDGYYAGADHKAPQATYEQLPGVFDEAGHKASHDGARKVDRVGAGDRRVGYAAYPRQKADIETPKLPGVPAWHNMAHLQLQEPAAMDYHHYPDTTATTALGRY